MKTRVCFTLLVLAGLILAGCADSAPAADTQATAIAVGVAATLAAQAPPPQTVIVVTPPPPTQSPTEPPDDGTAATPTAQAPPSPTATGTSPPPPTLSPTESPDAIDLMDLHLEADGSGDLPSLEEALVQSGAGATISLGPGSYRLDRALTVADSLVLKGAGRDLTEIVANVPGWVLRFQGDGPFAASGITFRHEGDAPADVVVVTTGEVSIQDCRFIGGVWGEDSGVGTGLSLEGTATGQVSDSEAMENELHGILLWDEAEVGLSNNVLRQNRDTGIAYFGHTRGKALQNKVHNNARYGIYIDDRAAPTLQGNIVHENGRSGIAYFGNAAGTARDNQCGGNGSAGIYVAENAAPWLEDNECELYQAVSDEQEIPTTADREIVYAAWRDDNEDIHTMWADGTGTVRLTDDPARDNEPAWSPDGSRIAFVAERDGNPEIYVMNADGSGQTRLTHDTGEDRGPDWSPDGSKIAFASSRGENWGIYTISPDGGEPVRISPDEIGGSTPAWSPDGKRIAMTIYQERMPLLAILNAETGELFGLTRNSNQDSQPAWSPDGEQIAFISATDEESNWIGPELYVIKANGLDRTRLTFSDDSTESSPTWSPDGSQIAFAGNPDGYGAIYRVYGDGTELTKISLGLDPSGYPDWSPLPAPSRGPRFNRGGDPWCYNAAAQGAAGDWQAVAPRDVLLPGEPAEIRLRDGAAQAGTTRPISARVITPDERQSSATTTIQSDEWLSLVYPDDFEGGDAGQRGAYTIIWETEGQFVACDGFLIGGGAGP